MTPPGPQPPDAHDRRRGGVRFNRVDLSGAEFFSARLSGVEAAQTDFSYARFLGRPRLSWPPLGRAFFPLRGASFGCDGSGACVTLKDVVFHGARAIAVQAVDERAKAFCGRFGFRPFSGREPLMLILRISELRAPLDA